MSVILNFRGYKIPFPPLSIDTVMGDWKRLPEELLDFKLTTDILGFPYGLVVKEFACQCRRHRRCQLNPWVGKISSGGANGNQLQYSCLENSMDRRAWWATVHRVAKSQKGLSIQTHDRHLKNNTLLLFSSKVIFNSLWSHGQQHAVFPVLHYLLGFAQIHGHWVVMLSYHLVNDWLIDTAGTCSFVCFVWNYFSSKIIQWIKLNALTNIYNSEILCDFYVLDDFDRPKPQKALNWTKVSIFLGRLSHFDVLPRLRNPSLQTTGLCTSSCIKKQKNSWTSYLRKRRKEGKAILSMKPKNLPGYTPRQDKEHSLNTQR